MPGFFIATGHVVRMPLRCGQAIHSVEFTLTGDGFAAFRASPCLYLPDFLRPRQATDEPACVTVARRTQDVVPVVVALADLNLPELSHRDSAHDAIQCYNELRSVQARCDEQVYISGPRVAEARAELLAHLLNEDDVIESWPDAERLARERLAQISNRSPAAFLVAAASLEDATLVAALAADARLRGVDLLSGLHHAAELDPGHLLDHAVPRLWPHLYSTIESAAVQPLCRWAATLLQHTRFWCLLTGVACAVRAAQLSGNPEPWTGPIGERLTAVLHRAVADEQAREQLFRSIRSQFLAGQGPAVARDAQRTDWVRQAIVWLVQTLLTHVRGPSDQLAMLEMVLTLYR